MSVYAVELEWYDELKQEVDIPSKYYFFDNAEEALDLAHDISWNPFLYKEYGSPRDVYLYKIEEGKAVDENVVPHYLTAFLDLDEVDWEFRKRLLID